MDGQYPPAPKDAPPPPPVRPKASLGDLQIQVGQDLEQLEADRKLGASIRTLGAALHTAISDEVSRQLDSRAQAKALCDRLIADLRKRGTTE